MLEIDLMVLIREEMGLVVVGCRWSSCSPLEIKLTNLAFTAC